MTRYWNVSISILASMTHTGIFEINQPDRGKVVTAHDEILRLHFSVFTTCLFVQSQYVPHNFDSVEANKYIMGAYSLQRPREIFQTRTCLPHKRITTNKIQAAGATSRLGHTLFLVSNDVGGLGGVHCPRREMVKLSVVLRCGWSRRSLLPNKL